ncbi:MAG: hypothetical protein BWK80_42015 [Desulfobacteraceae bacterium IS3]|nr:MAG: hypothetical protein BWK80_42015 [Desulfobacteraceae bacterium IS3]
MRFKKIFRRSDCRTKNHNILILFRLKKKRSASVLSLAFYCKTPELKTDASCFLSISAERSEKFSGSVGSYFIYFNKISML